MQLALALYNNHVDDEAELEFRKGDVLTVLIENPTGFDGWWLCKHRNKCGLCPENRLKLIQNTDSSAMKPNDLKHSSSRLSTASMYDSLTNTYDNPVVVSSSSKHDYENISRSDFISNSKPFDSSPDSSSRSSGIYSNNDPTLSFSSSTSSSEFYTTTANIISLSTIALDQLQNDFHKFSIRSSLLETYRQLHSTTNVRSILPLFIAECHSFLQQYGCLLDRSTYKLIKENLLYELEGNQQQIRQLSTKIIQLIQLRLKQKDQNHSLIPNDVLRRLHLEPIEELPNEKTTASLSTTRSYSNFHQKPQRTQMTTSKTCHSNFLSSSVDDYDYIEKDYSVNPLIKCYYRHINEQIDSIIKRYAHLERKERQISLFISDGKGLVVAGHKLVFVLETLHEHLHQRQTPLTHLTRQLCEVLTNFIQLLKQCSQPNSTNIQKLIIQCKQQIKMIMNIVTSIKYQCASV